MLKRLTILISAALVALSLSLAASVSAEANGPNGQCGDGSGLLALRSGDVNHKVRW